MELITEADKMAASKRLSDTILEYIASQTKFNKKLNLLTSIGLSVLFVMIMVGCYLIYDREKDIRNREQAMTVREKLHTLTMKIDSEDLEKRRNDIKFMMQKVVTQDSLNKIR